VCGSGRRGERRDAAWRRRLGGAGGVGAREAMVFGGAAVGTGEGAEAPSGRAGG